MLDEPWGETPFPITRPTARDEATAHAASPAALRLAALRQHFGLTGPRAAAVAALAWGEG